MGVQLSLKAALPLAERIATVSDCGGNIGYWYEIEEMPWHIVKSSSMTPEIIAVCKYSQISLSWHHFLQNTHKTHVIAHLWGRDMGCLCEFLVWSTVCTRVQRHSICNVIYNSLCFKEIPLLHCQSKCKKKLINKKKIQRTHNKYNQGYRVQLYNA